MCKKIELPKYEGIEHSEKIIKAWGDDYLWLQTKMDCDGRVKEKHFIKHFGTWLVDGFNCTHELGGKTFFYPSSLLNK